MVYEKRDRKNKSLFVDQRKFFCGLVGLGKNLTGSDQFKDLKIKQNKHKGKK
jgi:hypothetical protein